MHAEEGPAARAQAACRLFSLLRVRRGQAQGLALGDGSALAAGRRCDGHQRCDFELLPAEAGETSGGGGGQGAGAGGVADAVAAASSQRCRLSRGGSRQLAVQRHLRRG